jgi:Zn-dependent protease
VTPPGPQKPHAAPTRPTYAGTRPAPVRDRIKKVLAPVAGIGAALAKFGAVLVKLKAFTVVGSMAVSLAAYGSVWGWKFALGFVLLLAVHELGHVVVLRAHGIKASLPVFLPFIGAFVSMKSQPRSVYEEAQSALAGPVAGAIGAAVLAYAGHATGSDLLRSLGFTGFLLNLVNLLPALPLDGGRVAGALHPAVWLVGLLAALGYEVLYPSPILLIVIVVGGVELAGRWRSRRTASSRRYHSLLAGQRLRIGAAYVGLVVALVIAAHVSYVPRTF